MLVAGSAAEKAEAEARAAEDGVSSSFRKKGAHNNHPFFSYYGLLVHQQNMMQDTVRTGAYHTAIVSNAADFAGKTVMDVGTGSGILAYFAAKAGARKVYAVEASNVADRAATLLRHNGMGDKITIIKGKVEEVELPDEDGDGAAAGGAGAGAGGSSGGKVDVMVSEPMGFMLIHERMLESYMIARQMFLKPGGKMFPNSGTIFAAPFTDQTLWQEQINKIAFWYNTDFFGLDISCLADAAASDHFAQPVVGYVEPSSLMSSATATKVIDFEKDEPESLHSMDLPFDFVVSKTGICHGLALWFDVAFDGTTFKSVLSTAPGQPGTHWYQCRLLLKDPIAVNAKQRISGNLHMEANARYSYNLTLKMQLAGSAAGTADGVPIESEVHVSLQDQMYSYGSSTTTA